MKPQVSLSTPHMDQILGIQSRKVQLPKRLVTKQSLTPVPCPVGKCQTLSLPLESLQVTGQWVQLQRVGIPQPGTHNQAVGALRQNPGLLILVCLLGLISFLVGGRGRGDFRGKISPSSQEL